MEKKRYKISTYIFAPIMGVILLLMLTLFLTFSYGGIVGSITNESYENLKEKAENERNYLEHKMIYEWSAIDLFSDIVAEKFYQYSANHGYDIRTAFANAELNSQMLIEVSEDLINMLRDTKTTGVYVILDGKASDASVENAAKTGLYLRDNDPFANSVYNSDILLQTALPKVCDAVKVPMSSTWSATFPLDSDKYTSTDFYYKPYEAYATALANGEDVSDITNFGYWGSSMKTDYAEVEIITYSIPLIVDDTLIGVIGIDVSLEEIWSTMTEYLDSDRNSISYALGIVQANERDKLQVIQQIGTSYTKFFKNNKVLCMGEGRNNSVYLDLSEKNHTNQVVSYVLPLTLYNNNTPFEHMTWVVAALKSKDDVMAYTIHTRRSILVFSLLVFLTMSVALALVCKNLSKPVKKLADEVKTSSFAIEGKFTETKIKELNELIASFETMRRMILDNSNKMSEIVALTKLPLGVYEYDSSVGMTFCSESLLDMFDWRQDAQNGYIPDEQFQDNMEALKKNVYDEENSIYEVNDDHHGTRWIQIQSQEVNHRKLGTIMDVTKDILSQLKIEYERDYDVLTGLLNRRAFQSKIAEITKDPSRCKIGAMLMMDSDNLKFINDTYGHDTGDSYLKKIARSLGYFEQFPHIAGRFSGDEFYLFVYGFSAEEELHKVLEGYWAHLRAQSILLPDGTDFNIRCCGGVAWFPKDAENVMLLTQYADFAMYEMKHNSKGCWTEFNHNQFEKKEFLINGHKALEMLLSEKLIRHMFQPILEVQTGKVFGYELLMRSLISEFASPMDILRMARSQSRLNELEYVSIYKCYERYYEVLSQGELNGQCKIFMNSIGSACISREELQKMKEAFPHHHYDQMVVEMTEEDDCTLEELAAKCQLISDIGFQIALDDYGSGYSNLIHVLTINPAYIKVDMTIIRNIDQDEERQFILRQAISLARNKGAMVIAEGIETPAELEVVVDFGVDLVQGYYLGRPSFAFDSINQEAVEYMKNLYLKKNLFQ